ncbi:NADPH-dependent FMN reductase [Streptomyces sp. 900105755]|uniref:NADPH-dependent FMN reductase n=1 Tax=Streptomyces sp. 900105755 TaxID=3154389 RepID=UPI003322CFA2
MSPPTASTPRRLIWLPGSYSVQFVQRTITDRRVAVVVGSSRPTRICPGIAAWIREALQESLPSSLSGSVRYEILDLAQVGLPLLDEPLMPALGQYEHEHTKAWSRTVNGYDGFIFVFPQYNWGYPAILKNALDCLYQEWTGKPVSFATYGTRGGGRGARQVQGVFAGLHMRELYGHLEIVITINDVDSDWQVKSVDEVLAPYGRQLRAVGGQMLEAFGLPGGPGMRMTRPLRAVMVALRRARIVVGGALVPRRHPRRAKAIG